MWLWKPLPLPYFTTFRRFHKIFLNRPLASSCLSVLCLSAWNSSAPTGRIFMKFFIWMFFENPSRKFEFHWNLTKITDTLNANWYIYLTISRSFLLRMRNVAGKSVRENQNTFFMFNFFYHRESCCLWGKVKKYYTFEQDTDYNMVRANCMPHT